MGSTENLPFAYCERPRGPHIGRGILWNIQMGTGIIPENDPIWIPTLFNPCGKHTGTNLQ